MNTLIIERIAQALYGAAAASRGMIEPWEDLVRRAEQPGYVSARAVVQQFRKEACAALSILREPTGEMFDAFMSVNAEPAELGHEHRRWHGDFGQFIGSWQAMLGVLGDRS